MPFASHWSSMTSSFLLKPIPLRWWKQVLRISVALEILGWASSSSKRDAYCVFARSNSDCRSRVLEHRSNERWRSRDENRWKTRTPTFLGGGKGLHGRLSLTACVFSLLWKRLFASRLGSKRLESTSREVDIEPFVTNICCIKKKSGNILETYLRPDGSFEGGNVRST